MSSLYPGLPVVVLVGRPNVGKSTLFNRLIRSKRAITHDMPGVTRDKMDGVVRRDGRNFALTDTGGITLDEHSAVAQGPEAIRGFEEEILRHAKEAMEIADLIALVVDGRDGLTPFDRHLAEYIRKSSKPILLVVNKVDGAENADLLLAEFYALGLPMLSCSAEHGYNCQLLEETLYAMLPPIEAFVPTPEEDAVVEAFDPTAPLRLALLGRPNAGKSSLINALSGQERMIVSDVAGTTRDSVDVSVMIDGEAHVFVDTAGVRRPARVADTIERFSVNSSLKSSTKAHVTLLMLDGSEGLTQQDKRLLELLEERKTPFIILVNKSDCIPASERKSVAKDYEQALAFAPHLPILFVSVKNRYNLHKIIPLAKRLREECFTRIGTGMLNRAMEGGLTKHQPPMVKGRRAKFYYMTQAETAPPTFVFFVNDADRVMDSYVRYLERHLRKVFGISMAPMRLKFRSTHGQKKDVTKDVTKDTKEKTAKKTTRSTVRSTVKKAAAQKR